MSTDASGNQIPEPVSYAAGVSGGYARNMVYIVFADLSQLIASPDAVFVDGDGGAVMAESIWPGEELQTVSGPQTVELATLGQYTGGVGRLWVQGPTGTYFANGVLTDVYDP